MALVQSQLADQAMIYWCNSQDMTHHTQGRSRRALRGLMTAKADINDLSTRSECFRLRHMATIRVELFGIASPDDAQVMKFKCRD